ncbi:hypothetical protein LLG10_03720, partial [bacterium]|nr:hypothetical protein [bacterium]
STSRTVTHGYDANNGQLTSLQFSDLGAYTIDYLGNGNINTITYPNSHGEETYSYGGGLGRLSQIEYPNNDTLEFQWNDKDEITRMDYTVYATQIETRYTMTYTPNHQIATLFQSIDSMQQYVWTFTWAPNGLEKAVKSINGLPVLTQDFTTDPQGRILSMTYDTTGEAGYDGELYFHYDHFGNTTLLTDTNGSPVFSAQYNPCRGTTLQTWNTNSLEIMNLGQGRTGTISMSLPGNNTALLASSGTITISEETIASFNARAAKAVCYIESGFGPQEGNPDADPCYDCFHEAQRAAQLYYDFEMYSDAKENFNNGLPFFLSQNGVLMLFNFYNVPPPPLDDPIMRDRYFSTLGDVRNIGLIEATPETLNDFFDKMKNETWASFEQKCQEITKNCGEDYFDENFENGHPCTFI